MNVEQIIDGLIRREGGYSNNPDDAGGETMYGITAAVARRYGYTGAMRLMPVTTARAIYGVIFWIEPRFKDVAQVSQTVAEELADTGVNCGPAQASLFLQRCLNALNLRATLYPDVLVDGRVGDRTIAALRAYLRLRGAEGEQVLLRALNCLQGAYYVGLAEGRPRDETFVYGWILNRVTAA